MFSRIEDLSPPPRQPPRRPLRRHFPPFFPSIDESLSLRPFQVLPRQLLHHLTTYPAPAATPTLLPCLYQEEELLAGWLGWTGLGWLSSSSSGRGSVY